MFTSLNLNLRYPSQTLRTGLAAIGGLGLFAASIYFFADNAHAESTDSTPRVFSSVFGQRLRLASAEVVNHNTKLLRFELPHAHARCGFPLTCKPSRQQNYSKWILIFPSVSFNRLMAPREHIPCGTPIYTN